jgi:hypothetical protein
MKQLIKAVTRLYLEGMGYRSQVWKYLDFLIKFCTTTVGSVERIRDYIVRKEMYILVVGLYILLVCEKNCNTSVIIYISIIDVSQ